MISPDIAVPLYGVRVSSRGLFASSYLRLHASPKCRYLLQARSGNRHDMSMPLGEWWDLVRGRSTRTGAKACRACGKAPTSTAPIRGSDIRALLRAVAKARRAQGDIEGARRAAAAAKIVGGR